VRIVSGHTPTPWRVDPKKLLRVVSGDDNSVATVGLQSDLCDQWEANAAFIVKAVNSHDALVKKLEEIHDITQDTTLGVECWQKIQNIEATAASALASIKEPA